MKELGIQYAKNFLPVILKNAQILIDWVQAKKTQKNYSSMIWNLFFESMVGILFGKNFE